MYSLITDLPFSLYSTFIIEARHANIGSFLQGSVEEHSPFCGNRATNCCCNNIHSAAYVHQYNCLNSQPDVLKSLYSALQPASPLEELRYHDGGRLSDQQMALLQYQRKNIHYLSEEILRLQECLSKYERSDDRSIPQVDLSHLLAARDQKLRELSAEMNQVQSELRLARNLIAKKDLEVQRIYTTNSQDILKTTWETEKAVLEQLKNESEKNYAEINEQILHNHLEALHIKVAESCFGGSSRSIGSAQHGDLDLQSVVHYLRRSKEIAETEISLLKKENLRLRSQSERANSRSLIFSDEEFKSLQIQVREINLLRESNNQLREENKNNFEECQGEVNSVKWDASGSLLASCFDNCTAKELCVLYFIQPKWRVFGKQIFR
ncbi:hypothetical protein MKW98_010656 [Papaver atlanticum]|uniref:Uncharacterized protein n=1 Tax=Papaver atlanticum TaxID=357466 RepID=A0AAD4SGS6_9MAGN|nr:hypothetical protein MKW98_010656 [Papaver atlanticum]